MSSSSSSATLIDVLLFTATTAIAIGSFSYHRRRPKPRKSPSPKRRVSFKLPGEREPMLPTTQSQVLGLLFAANWCPDCTDVVPAIGEFVGNASKEFLEVFYVSSDQSEEEMKGFLPNSLTAIPYSMEDQRRRLKQQYQTCAAKEMEGLGISKRKNGIPTLILLEASSGRVLTETAHDDVMKGTKSKELIAQWKALL